jgi:hypothetical protein
MARLLIEREWFDSISPDAIYERDFENLLLANAEYLYPSYSMARFKALVESEYGRAKADLALIDNDYRDWWVVEVELGSHPLRGHVEEQVTILATARYGADEARRLAEANHTLDFDRLAAMMRGRQPRVFVIVNQAKPAWSSALARSNAIVGVAEIFRSRRENLTVLRINGEQPVGVGDVITACRVDALMPNMLRVESPAGLGFGSDETIEIWFEGGLTQWARLDTGAAAWLTPLRRNPLPPALRSFVIRRDNEGRLTLEPM